MNYEILPGPSLAELARTALARAAAATVSEAGPANARQDVAGRVPVRTRPDGSPLLLAATGTALNCSCSPRTAPWPSGCRSRTARSARSRRSGLHPHRADLPLPVRART